MVASMNVSVDVAYKSLNKHHEELCGDKVEILSTHDSNIIILADGMGSGVKANILATLTSKILGTMFLNGASLEDCVQTIVKTLPVCQVRQVAYSTFSILQIFQNGNAYLVEFDNPNCVFIRDGKLFPISYEERIIEGKAIKEFRFQVKTGDTFILMSDGVIYAGVGKILNFGWTWQSMADYAVNSFRSSYSASRLASILSKACDDLYMQSPGDDTTIAVTRIIEEKRVRIFTGPPLRAEDDLKAVRDFMSEPAFRIVSGGTSANIISRILDRPIKASLDYADPDIPPVATIEGIDLVTEGILTLSRVLQLMREYASDNISEDFFFELDKPNGASQIAKVLIENCTHLDLFVGQTINEAHQNPGIPLDLSIRVNIIRQLADISKKLGKTVTLTYY